MVLTGARQTGKTTLARYAYPDLRYINFDAPEEREIVRSTRSAEWHSVVGLAVIDEVQKEPLVFEKVKYAFDAGDLTFSVLLGSSQILLLKNIRESLAGRAVLYELFPLLMSELCDKTSASRTLPLIDALASGTHVKKLCRNIPPMLTASEDAPLKSAEEHLLLWGGMPALLPKTTEERWKWLKDYEYTYLERDLADLSRIQDLQPFRRFQRVAALRSGQLLNYADCARDGGVSPDTARRYLEYLRISYQAMLLPPYHRNITSTLVKSPKLYWLDCGLLRQASGFHEGVSGALYETMVIAETVKWIRTLERDAELFFYRTRSGLEADLLLQTGKGMIGAEIKARETVNALDARPLCDIASKLKEKWLGGIVVYRGNSIEKIADPDIYAFPSRRLFC